MRRLILEHIVRDGLYAYVEEAAPFREQEPKRAKISRQLDSTELAEECHLQDARYATTNWYMVFELASPARPKRKRR